MIRHRIPKENQQEIIDTFSIIEKYLPFPPDKYMVYLFDIYNGYIKPPAADDEKMTCGDCRVKVISKVRFLVNQWKQEQANSNK